MRITVKLDKDVVRALRREMFRAKTSLGATVNHSQRMGLQFSGRGNRKPFVVDPKPLGLPLGRGHDCVEEILENFDGIAHK